MNSEDLPAITNDFLFHHHFRDFFLTFRILSAGASNQWFIKLQMQLQLGPAVMDSLDKPKWNLLSRDSH
jgi:hypothetical protein